MSFEVAIYNGFCEDGTKIMNSVKAAYLYADKVRVYDFYKPGGYEEFLEMADPHYYLRKYRVSEEVLGRYKQHFDGSLSKDEDEALLHKYMRSSSGEFEDYLHALEYHFSELDYKSTRKHVEKINDTLKKREQSTDKYKRRDFYNGLSRLNVKYFEPVIEISGMDPYISSSFQRLVCKFSEDKGIKVINDPPVIGDTKIPSTWTPAYIAELTITKLPHFDFASIDEMIQIKTELEQYIEPFQKAITKMAQKVKDIPDHDALQRECESLYLSEIEPKVIAINKEVDRNTVINNILEKAQKTKLDLFDGLNFVYSAVTGGNVIRALVESSVPPIGRAVVGGIAQTRENERRIQDENELYFLYEASKMLNE